MSFRCFMMSKQPPGKLDMFGETSNGGVKDVAEWGTIYVEATRVLIGYTEGARVCTEELLGSEKVEGTCTGIFPSR